MTFTDSRPNWLSEIIEANWHASDRPVPLLERISQRDAILAAISAHPEGQAVAALPNLAEVVWGALGAAYHWQRDAEQNPQLLLSSPAIHASLVIFSLSAE
jgi:hypothetical protein